MVNNEIWEREREGNEGHKSEKKEEKERHKHKHAWERKRRNFFKIKEYWVYLKIFWIYLKRKKKKNGKWFFLKELLLFFN